MLFGDSSYLIGAHMVPNTNAKVSQVSTVKVIYYGRLDEVLQVLLG
jgi:hypothetical protein